jgi:hypothetical protein
MHQTAPKARESPKVGRDSAKFANYQINNLSWLQIGHNVPRTQRRAGVGIDREAKSVNPSAPSKDDLADGVGPEPSGSEFAGHQRG